MEKRSSKYNRIITAILMIFISIIVSLNFVLCDKKFNITSEIIICLSLLLILCLADSFDNLTIPKFISLSKDVKKVKDDNDRLKETNLKLMEQIANIRNTNNQIMCIPGTLNTVGSSNIEDITTKQKEETESIDNEKTTNKSISEQRKIIREKY